MKPVTPLQAENGPKMAVSYEQRCQWFQPCAERNSQRCQWFHFEAVTHPHWCHRFQARWLVGVVRWLWPHRREKVRPAGEKGRFWGVLCALGELFRAWVLMEASRANFVALVGLGRGRNERKIAPAGGAVGFCEIFFALACSKALIFASFWGAGAMFLSLRTWGGCWGDMLGRYFFQGCLWSASRCRGNVSMCPGFLWGAPDRGPDKSRT